MSKTLTTTTTIYTFAELLELEKNKKISSQAMDKVRSYLQDVATDGDWYDYVYGVWKEALEQIGFGDIDISFRGFCSQGDGASFTAKVWDFEKLIRFMGRKIRPSKRILSGKDGKENFLPWIVHKIAGKVDCPQYRKLLNMRDSFDEFELMPNHVSMDIVRNHSGGNYVHEYTCKVDWEHSDRGMKEETEELLDAFAKDVEELRCDLCKAIHANLEEEYDALTSDDNYLQYEDEWFDIHGNHEIP